MRKLLAIFLLFNSINYFEYAESAEPRPYSLSIRQRNSRGQSYSYSNRSRRYEGGQRYESDNRFGREHIYSDEEIQQYGDTHYRFDRRGNITHTYKVIGNSIYVYNRNNNIVKIIRY